MHKITLDDLNDFIVDDSTAWKNVASANLNRGSKHLDIAVGNAGRFRVSSFAVNDHNSDGGWAWGQRILYCGPNKEHAIAMYNATPDSGHSKVCQLIDCDKLTFDPFNDYCSELHDGWCALVEPPTDKE